MIGPHFEWDPRKEAQNIAKHGVTFLEAQTVFEDEEALFMPDPDIRVTKSASSCSA